MIENLLDGKLNNRQIRLLEEADAFDLEDFYLNKGFSSGGVCLITENQMLMTDCYIKIDKNSNYGMHKDTVEEIYQAIYDNNEFDFQDNMWEEKITNDGNILIRLCSKAPTTIWLPNPEKIKSEQMEMLKAFSRRIDFIVQRNYNYFTEHPIIFEYNIKDKYLSVTENNIDEIIEILNNNKKRR